MSKVKLIEATAPWCGVCKMIKPSIERFMSKMPEVEFMVVDIENDKIGADLVKSYGVKSVPAFFFYKDDVCVEHHIGNISLGELKIKLNNLK